MVEKNDHTAEIMVRIVDRHGNKQPTRGLQNKGTAIALSITCVVPEMKPKQQKGALS